MLYKELKELEDCEQCPLLREEICKGGITCSPSGEPIEPPCYCFDDDTDLDKWVEEYYNRLAYYEEQEHQKFLSEQERKRKAEKAKRRRDYLKRYCFTEAMEVKRAREELASSKAVLDFAESMAFAINATNEMFRYSERVSIRKDKIDDLKRLEIYLENAKQKLKEKQREGRNTDEYKSIGREDNK